MDMKVSPHTIKTLREARGWTQEHLAEVAGLSARTVQRIEAEGNASAESRMALAAALGVDATALGAQPEPSQPDTAPSPVLTNSSRPRTLRRHLVLFLLICGGLIAHDFANHDAITWSKWPLLGWGLGLLLHWRKIRSAMQAASPQS